ncbi:MAG: polysaccharide biosynthesis/export family protein [Nitrospirae bacterium]|nr:polysaccharide biosynthesis/export family protein [Nitrospirota bacterium]
MFAIVLLSVSAFAKDYVIGDGDSLQVSVWGNPELSVTITVRPDGKISLPAVGEIKASGLTPADLTRILEKEMTKVVKTPIVTVIVTTMTNYRINVIGRGVTAGVRTLSRETSLLEFLSQLGALDNADLDNAYLVRDGKTIKTGFYNLIEKGDLSQNIALEPNDILFIPDNFANRISVVGAVARPSTIPYREGATIMDAILSVGGFTEFAKENDVEVLRKQDNGERSKISVKAKDLMKGDLGKNVLLMRGDVVVVKESLF